MAIPLLSYTFLSENPSDAEKMRQALTRLGEGTGMRSDPESAQIILQVESEQQFENILKAVDVKLNYGPPQVLYKERLTGTCSHKETFIRHERFACIEFEIGPGGEGEQGLAFTNLTDKKLIPDEFIPAIEYGFRESMGYGVLAGFPCESARIVLTGGMYHEVDSSKLTFDLAARIGFKNAALKCQPRLLEPVMQLEIQTTAGFEAALTHDLNSRRAAITAIKHDDNRLLIEAEAPLAGLLGYGEVLEQYFGGSSLAELSFLAYREVPQAIADVIIVQVKNAAAS